MIHSNPHDSPRSGTTLDLPIFPEQTEEMSVINVTRGWEVSGTSPAEPTKLPQHMLEMWTQPAPDTSPGDSRVFLPQVRKIQAEPISGTSPFAATWPKWQASEILIAHSFSPSAAELTMRWISKFLTIAGFGQAYAEPSGAQEATSIQDTKTGEDVAEQTLPEPVAKLSPQATHRAIAELRRISGLTSEQVGRLFGVSRRSIHAWVSGNPLNARNEERLMRALDVIRYADRGFARNNRVALFDTSKGLAPYDLLAEQKFDEAREALGQGTGRTRRSLPELSPEARAALEPLRPEVLLNANPDPIRGKPGRIRAARTTRNKRRGLS